MKFLLGFLLLCIVNVLYSQGYPNKNVSLKVKVIIIDSAYLLVPELKILSDTQNIQIHNTLAYGGETDMGVDCNMFFEKEIHQRFVGVYLTAFRDDFSPDETFKNYTSKDRLNDTINIKDYLPFEIGGDYWIVLGLNYYTHGVKDQVISDKFPFHISFPPKNRKYP